MQQFITIGEILRPRGLRGEVKVRILTNCVSVFGECKEFVVNKKPLTALKVSIQGDFAYMNFYGITSVESAEKLRGASVEVERSIIELADDEVLSSDLIGFEVVGTNGKSFGKLKSVENYGGGEIFETAFVSFPNEDVFVIETNMKERKIIVNEDMLEEEVVL